MEAPRKKGGSPMALLEWARGVRKLGASLNSATRKSTGMLLVAGILYVPAAAKTAVLNEYCSKRREKHHGSLMMKRESKCAGEVDNLSPEK